MGVFLDEIIDLYKGESKPVFKLTLVDTNEYTIDLMNTISQAGTMFAKSNIATEDEATDITIEDKIVVPKSLGKIGRKFYDDGVLTSDSASLSIGVLDAERIEIEIEDLVCSGGGSAFVVGFNGDVGANYGYCYQTSSTSTGTNSSGYINIGGTNALLNGRTSFVITNSNANNVKTMDFVASLNTGGTIKGAGTWINVTDKITTVDIAYTSSNLLNSGLKYKVYYYPKEV